MFLQKHHVSIAGATTAPSTAVVSHYLKAALLLFSAGSSPTVLNYSILADPLLNFKRCPSYLQFPTVHCSCLFPLWLFSGFASCRPSVYHCYVCWGDSLRCLGFSRLVNVHVSLICRVHDRVVVLWRSFNTILATDRELWRRADKGEQGKMIAHQDRRLDSFSSPSVPLRDCIPTFFLCFSLLWNRANLC